MHRTESIDYAVVLSGQLEMDVPNGQTVKLGPGDLLVQQATSHAWKNRSKDWVR